MDTIKVFRAVPAGTVNLSATTSSSRVQVLTNTIIQNTNGTHIIRVYNAGSVAVFIEFGNSTVTASTTADTPIAPGSVESFHVFPYETHVAAITASGSATVYFSPGEGL